MKIDVPDQLSENYNSARKHILYIPTDVAHLLRLMLPGQRVVVPHIFEVEPIASVESTLRSVLS